MNTDIYVYIPIIIIIIIILYYLFIYNNKHEEDTILIYKNPNNVIPKFSNDNIKKEDNYKEIHNEGYVNDLLIKPTNTTNEYAKQFSDNISEPIDLNSIGFCPNAKEEKKALPFANMNIQVLLSNPPQ